MNNNMSPWLYQLIHKRPIDTLREDVKTGVAIVGAGIAGVMTAYNILKYTNKEVLLIEADQVAHGATGRNAGQLIGEFERELHSIAEEFGAEAAIHAEKLINTSWLRIEEIYQDAQLTTPYSTFMGYNGYETIERLMNEFKNNALRLEAGEQVHAIYISDTAKDIGDIPVIYKELYNIIPHQDILDLLETNNTKYIAAMSLRKGCINGAMLCEEIVGYMLSVFQGRFVLAEHTPIQEIILENDYAQLRSNKYLITANRVVLCTNGFSKFKITNNEGHDIENLFHHQLHGLIGYMAAYIEELNQQPNALAYYGPRTKKSKHKQRDLDMRAEGEYYDDPYFYLTRRPYELEKNERHNLVCLGGPEAYLIDSSVYERHGEYDQKITDSMNEFLKNNYRHTPKDNLKFKFTWHGLMGYTQNGIRLIGFEPLNPVLMYNLGCNGVGILPSIFGASRIADLLNGVSVRPTIFDPRRCGDKAC